MSLLPRSNFFDIDRFISDSWPQAMESRGNSFFAPRVDIKEVDDHYEITAELPGVNKDDIHVHVKDGILTLEAEINQENKEEEGGKVIRQERRYGKYMRSFNLGADVHDNEIKASFKDGVLNLQAPKLSEKDNEPKRISID